MTRGDEEKVRTAGERLERIEAWGRRTCYAAIAAAVMLAAIAGVIVYVGVDYMRVKGAMQEASAKMQSAAAERRGVTIGPGNPGTRLGRSGP